MRHTDMRWRKASRSSNNGGACVEVASLPDAIAVRDSKAPETGMLTFDPAHWATFMEKIRRSSHGAQSQRRAHSDCA